MLLLTHKHSGPAHFLVLVKTDLFRALHISMVTSTDKAMVMGYGDSNSLQSRPWKSGFSGPHCRKWLWKRKAVKKLAADEVVCLFSRQKLFGFNSYQLVKADPRTVLSSNKPPGSSTNSGSTNITCRDTRRQTDSDVSVSFWL